MTYINHKIKELLPEVAVMKNPETKALFSGRNIPSYVKDYIIRRFSDSEGVIDKDGCKEYLRTKMPDVGSSLKSKLISGERINITTRIIVKTDIAQGKVLFSIPDVQIDSNAYIPQKLVEENKDAIVDGEIWCNITLEYVEPKGRKNGSIVLRSFKSFEPYKVDMEYFKNKRTEFELEEWIDFLIVSMEYNPDKMDSIEQKIEFISRLLVLVEPGLNMIELGPKGTGKSYVYNNISKHAWVVSGGKISRAKLFYNKSNRQFGIMKHYDLVAIDEISSFGFVDPDEMQSIFKGYLEAGSATVDNVKFLSDCGVALMGNLPLDSDHKPLDKDCYKVLPEMFHESATMDRFHGFIEGWKLPRLKAGSILQGWSIDSEYISSVFHKLRTTSDYELIFDKLVEYEKNCDLRDLKAVRRVSTAYHKLLFPHITNLTGLDSEQLDEFRNLYSKYCLLPAVKRRSIIRNQCHLIDKEFTSEMPVFSVNSINMD